MKSYIMALSILSMVVCFASAGYPADRSRPSRYPDIPMTGISSTILGRIVSIEADKDAVLVRDQETDTVKAIQVKPEQLEKLKVGTFVKVVLVPGSTLTAGTIEILKPDKGHRERRHRRMWE